MDLQIIKDEMQKFKEANLFLKDISDAHLFALMSTAYYYFDGEIKQSQYELMFVDGNRDGEFDVVFNDEQSDENDLIMVQSKFSQNIDKNNILAIFDKMHRTCDDLRKGRYEKYNSKVREAFINGDDAKGESANDYLVLVTIYNPKDKIKKEIETEINRNPNLKKYKILIFYGEDILSQINSIKDPQDYIDYDKLAYYQKNGKVLLENGLGAVVNVSALDLKRLYVKYKSKGLFNRNLRFYIKQKKVDDGILTTLKSSRDQFWYLNNGIIIGCSDFELDGNNIKLYDFSIINGAQTTSLIGESSYVDSTTNFPVVCKIIKYTDDDFINKVAEASNSQKPINERDLISNRLEQRNLKKALLEHNPPVFMEVKRGEKKPTKSKFPETWQRVKNEDIGQLILSMIYQRPGTARSNKKTIFSVDGTYCMVFRRQQDIDTIVDMLRVKTIYENYINKSIETFEKTLKGIANNGKFCILALIGFFIKLKRNEIDDQTIKLLLNSEKSKETKEVLERDNISGKLFSNNDDYIEKIEDLIYELIDIVADCYDSAEETGKVTSYSNFLKTDNTYQTIILPTVLGKYLNKRRIKDTIDEDMKAFT